MLCCDLNAELTESKETLQYVSIYMWTQSLCIFVVPIIAFEELEYTFSETDRAANVCVVTVN